MERLFNKSLTNSFNSWLYKACPEKQLPAFYEEIKDTNTDQYSYITKCGALQKLEIIHRNLETRTKSIVFKQLMKNMYSKKAS